jgi:hypothetical protein
MKRHLLTFIALVFLLSCGQNQTSLENKSDNLDLTHTKGTKKEIEKIKTIPTGQKCAFKNSTSDLGIGLIIVPATFEIFNDSLLTKKHSTINMYEDEDKINVCSMFYKPDYGIMHFVCLSQTDKSYKVLTAFDELKYLPKNSKYEFHPWNNYILQSFGVRRLTEEDGKLASGQSLRNKPSDDSKTITIPKGYEMFCPMEIEGDWIKVKYDCFYNNEDNKHKVETCQNYITKCDNTLTGWLKWRNKNELLIDIFLMP